MRVITSAAALTALVVAGCGSETISPEVRAENTPGYQATFAGFKQQYGDCLAGTTFDIAPQDNPSQAIFTSSADDGNRFYVQ